MKSLLLGSCALLSLACVAAAADVKLVEDPPTSKAPEAGDLAGRIANPSSVAALAAVSRVTGKRYTPKSFDPKTGRFVFAKLPGDAYYDVCIKTAEGQRIEGIDLSWFECRMLALADKRREELGVPAPSDHTFSKTDADALIKFVANREDFSDLNRPLYIRGDAGRAVMLVERIRSTKFHASKAGELIWRTDLWYFTFDAGGWQLLGRTERLVERHRFVGNAWDSFAIVYEAALSGYVNAKGDSKPIVYTIGATFDPTKGRVAGAATKQPAKPVVLGLPAATTRPGNELKIPAEDS